MNTQAAKLLMDVVGRIVSGMDMITSDKSHRTQAGFLAAYADACIQSGMTDDETMIDMRMLVAYAYQAGVAVGERRAASKEGK